MKYSLRKSFNRRRRKETSEDKNFIYPTIDTSSSSNLVKSKNSRRRRSSSPVRLHDQNKSKVFEPRYDINSDSDDDDNPFPSPSINPPKRPFQRLTNQIRKSFRNTLTRQQATSNKNNENPTQFSILYPNITTGLTSPLVPTSIIIPNEPKQKPFNRSIRTRFSFLRKKSPENLQSEEKTSSGKITLSQRFNSLRRSFHFGNKKNKTHLLSNQ